MTPGTDSHPKSKPNSVPALLLRHRVFQLETTRLIPPFAAHLPKKVLCLLLPVAAHQGTLRHDFLLPLGGFFRLCTVSGLIRSARPRWYTAIFGFERFC